MTDAGSFPSAGAAAQEVAHEFERAYADLMQTLQELLTASAQQERVNAAYFEYAALLQAALSGHDVHQQGSQAYGRYIQAFQEALSAAPQQQRTLEAFRRYAARVRDAWIAIDPSALEPAVAAAIAQSFMTAASTVAGIASGHAAPAIAGTSPYSAASY